MRKITIAIGTLIIFLIVITLSPGKAELDSTDYLKQGKNLVKVNNTAYARDLMAANPEIEYISYFDEFLNKNIAYVNVFGGIGDNFPINPDQIYEISVKENIRSLKT